MGVGVATLALGENVKMKTQTPKSAPIVGVGVATLALGKNVKMKTHIPK
jgi:hypothetical protein